MSQEVGFSIKETEEVMAAKRTRIKKITAHRVPKGMESNTAGSVIKIRPGPAEGSKPNAKTAGRMAKPASSAAQVSNKGTTMESFSM